MSNGISLLKISKTDFSDSVYETAMICVEDFEVDDKITIKEEK